MCVCVYIYIYIYIHIDQTGLIPKMKIYSTSENIYIKEKKHVAIARHVTRHLIQFSNHS